jgi:zinc protease
VSSATATVQALPRPITDEPGRDGVGEWHVEACLVGPYPRLHGHVVVRRLRGIQVDATDDITIARVEDGERETFALDEVVRVAAQVGSEGTSDSLPKISGLDLEAYRKRVFARDTLRVVAVGDIDGATLGTLLDKVFGTLPAKAKLDPVPTTVPSAKDKLEVIEMEVPQSVAQFGMLGIPRKDPDFMAAFVLNQILGGGGFASRLTEEVREKRGLAYSVYSYIQPYEHTSIFGGGVATKNDEIAQSLDVIRAELKRMADDGPTPAELDNAKKYLTGSFALRFDSNSKIANQLLWILRENMGIDYVDKRNALVEAVTLDDMKRVAKRLLKTDDLIVTIVGKPKGLMPRG